MPRLVPLCETVYTCFGTVWLFWCWCAVKLWYHHHPALRSQVRSRTASRIQKEGSTSNYHSCSRSPVRLRTISRIQKEGSRSNYHSCSPSRPLVRSRMTSQTQEGSASNYHSCLPWRSPVKSRMTSRIKKKRFVFNYHSRSPSRSPVRSRMTSQIKKQDYTSNYHLHSPSRSLIRSHTTPRIQKDGSKSKEITDIWKRGKEAVPRSGQHDPKIGNTSNSQFPIWLGGGWIRLIVGFQPLMVISPTESWIRWCMQVYVCELMWTCLVWAEGSTPDSFWVPNHRFNSATGEQKGITQTIVLTPSRPVGCLTH